MKKFLAVALLLSLCFSLVACGDTAEPTQAPTETTETTAATESSPVAPVSQSTPLQSNGTGCAGDNGSASE